MNRCWASAPPSSFVSRWCVVARRSPNRYSAHTGATARGESTGSIRVRVTNAPAAANQPISINADSRHRGVFIVQRGPVEARAFDQWQMGFARRPKAEIEAVDGFVDFFSPGRQPPQASSKTRADLERVLASVVSPA